MSKSMVTYRNALSDEPPNSLAMPLHAPNRTRRVTVLLSYMLVSTLPLKTWAERGGV